MNISQRIAEGLGHHNPTRRDYVYRRARAGVPEGGGGPMIEPVLTCRHCRFTVRPEEGRLGEHGPVNNRCPGSNKPIAEVVTEHDFKEYGKYRRRVSEDGVCSRYGSDMGVCVGGCRA